LRRRKRLVRDPLAAARLTRPNQEWAMDFIADGLANGRLVRILGSGRVTRVLEAVTAEHGRPESLRSGNGLEFCLGRILGWAEGRKIALAHLPAGEADAERA
jgi:putative transposase